MAPTHRRLAAPAALPAAVVIASALIVASRGSGDPLGYVKGWAADQRALAAKGGASEGAKPSSLEQALPNVTFDWNGSEGHFSTRLIDGTVTAVTHGDGFWHKPDPKDVTNDAAIGTWERVKFDDPRTVNRQLVVTVTTADGPVTLLWWLNGQRMSLGARAKNPNVDDADQIADGLKALGHVLVLANADGIMLPQYVLQVASDDSVSAPFRAGGRVWIGSLDDGRKVHDQASQPEHTETVQ